MTDTAKAKTCETPTARQKRVWDKTAPGYDRQIAFFEKTWFAGGRQWLGARARSRVLEVAVGTGRSLPYYPPGVTVTVTGIELSPAMLAIARQRAADLGVGGLGRCQQVAEHGLSLGQFGQAPLGRGQVLLQQGGDVSARRAAVVADHEDAADLSKGEAGGLGSADESEAGVARHSP